MASGSAYWPVVLAAAVCSGAAFSQYRERSKSLEKQLLEESDIRDKDGAAPPLEIPFAEEKESLYKLIDQERAKHVRDIEELRNKIAVLEKGKYVERDAGVAGAIGGQNPA